MKDHKIRCDFCKRWAHQDEISRLRRPHKYVLICAYCVEGLKIPEREILKQKVR